MATQAAAILAGLQKANGILALATVAEGIVVPFIQGIIKDVQQKVGEDGTVEYTVVLKSGQDELNQIKQLAQADLDAINKVLVAGGEQPIQAPADPSQVTQAPSSDAKKT